jgi:hypothetical protein
MAYSGTQNTTVLNGVSLPAWVLALPIGLLALGEPASVFGAAPVKQATSKEEKTVTVISAEGKFDGRSEISRETVKDCIAALPEVGTLEPEVTSENIFLREVNGDPNKNEWVRVYTAKLDVHYLQTKKEMLVVTTRSVQGQEPVFKELDKSLHQTKSFVSDPASGDLFAGRSKRQYYFSKPEDAIKDVRERAKSWVNQHKSVLCKTGP